MNALRKRDLDRIEGRLRALHARLSESLAELQRGSVGDPARPIESESDAGTVDAAQEAELGVLEQEGVLLAEVVEALRRLDQGGFGRCEDCGGWIALERLEVLPYARRCVGCETRSEGA